MRNTLLMYGELDRLNWEEPVSFIGLSGILGRFAYSLAGS